MPRFISLRSTCAVLDRNTVYNFYYTAREAQAAADRLNAMHKRCLIYAHIRYWLAHQAYAVPMAAFMYVLLYNTTAFTLAVTMTICYVLFCQIVITLGLIFKDFPDENI